MSEHDPPQETDKQPRTIVSLLSLIKEVVDQLENDIGRALGDIGDRKDALLLNLIQERTGLVAGLPEILDNYEENDGHVPDVVKQWATKHAADAKQLIEQGDVFGMRAVLIEINPGIGGPNNSLEKLIAELNEDNS